MKNIFLLLCLFSLLACSDREYETQGYVEGKFTYLASSGSGRLMKLLVAGGSYAKKNDVLFVLDPEPELSSMQKAEQQLLEAQTLLEKANSIVWLTEKTFERQQTLVSKLATEKASFDAAQSAMEQAKAEQSHARLSINEANAALRNAKWAYEQKTVRAPKDGLVYDTYFQVGEFVPAARPVVSTLEPEDIKFVFFIKEKYLAGLTLGGPVTITCDGCPKPIKAGISFISPNVEYTPPVIFSKDTRQKLSFRIEAIMSPEHEMLRMHPGQPVTVRFK